MSWERLIRFEDTAGNTQFGEPTNLSTDASLDDLVARGILEARCLQGTSIFSLVSSAEIVKVKRILGLLSPSDVPIIKCVGLNYMKHSKATSIPLPPSH